MTALEYKGQRVITTAVLAEAYSTDPRHVSNNFTRNKGKFVEGKHYFYLFGDELKTFKGTHLLDDCLATVSHLYLWTERGANRHCKILDTDKAWEQFDHLEETYFRVKTGNVLPGPKPEALQYLGHLANYLKVQRRIMLDSGCSPQEVAAMDKMTCQSFGVAVPAYLGEPRGLDRYEQLFLKFMSEHALPDGE